MSNANSAWVAGEQSGDYDTPGSRALLPWGKWGTGLSSAPPLPLLAHLLDTAAIALAVWPKISGLTRRNAVEVLAPGDPELARVRFAVLAGLHDLGKCEGVFQGQRWSRRPSMFDGHVADLKAAGFPVPKVGSRPSGPEIAGLFRHEAVTAAVLRDNCGLPAWARQVVAGHHGRYQRPDSTVDVPAGLREFRAAAKSSAWAGVQDEIVAAVIAAVTEQTGIPVSLENWPTGVASRLVAFVPALTGLVCVCDWLASDENFVNAAPQRVLRKNGAAAYLLARKAAAKKTVTRLWADGRVPSGAFPVLFDGKEPRGDAQKWAVETEHGPGLTILTVPMGEGKTEAALWMHSAGAVSGEGLYFGLPTMGMADSMFARVRDFWAGTDGVGRLAHSRAILNAFYAPSAVIPTGICDSDNDSKSDGPGGDEPGLRPVDWFAGRHRGLLAPVTVGTCDQVLAAALNHKYLPVRLAGLTGKHLVLDEIHTYDPYQHRLLCRLLGWLGAHRTRVTLLTATLPTARVRELVTAWENGWHTGKAVADRPDVEAALVGLSYPGAVRAGDTIETVQFGAWREFDLRIESRIVRTDRIGSLQDTLTAIREVRAQVPDGRIGVIVNTVDRAIALFKDLAKTEQGRVVLLHSRMTGAQRTAAMTAVYETAGQDSTPGPVLVVATQIAEASLNLDFDELFSDLAPMASLLQRAGRLWRYSTPAENGWVHPSNQPARTGTMPSLRVLVPADPGTGIVPPGACLPYSQAEISRTWTEPACLGSGTRTSLTVPGDVQQAVDAANVTLETLLADPVDGPATKAVLTHLGTSMRHTGLAGLAGTDVADFAKTWRPETEKDWSTLTSPVLWDETAGSVTRLSETDTADVLLYDPTGRAEFAWHGTAEDLMHVPSGPRTGVCLLATVPVSGSLASALKALSAVNCPPDWRKKAPVLLRGTHPVPILALRGLARLDPVLGLVREPSQ